MMNFHHLHLSAMLLLASASGGWLIFDSWSNAGQTCSVAQTAQDKRDPADEQTIRNLIKQLGDDSYQNREDASKALAAIGMPALDLLQKTAKETTDAEVRLRAEQLVRSIGSTVFSQVRRFEGHNNAKQPWVTRVVVTPDGSQAISVGVDALRAWDLKSGKQGAVDFDERKGAYCFGLAISPDGKRVIAGCGGKQGHVFDVKTGQRVNVLLGHTDAVWGVALLADGKRALTGAWDQSIRLWDIETGKEISAFEGVHDKVRCLVVSPDEKMVAAGHFEKADGPGTIRLWDLDMGKEIRALTGHTREVTSISFAADGKTLLSSSFDKTVRLWDVATGKESKRFEGHPGKVECAVFTPDGKRIISAGDQTNPSLRMWDVATGKQLFESEEVKGGFLGLAVLPDGRQCVTSGRDLMVRLWQWAR